MGRLEKIKKLFKKHKQMLSPQAVATFSILFVVLFGIYAAQAAIDNIYKDRLLPGVVIGDREFGRLSLTEAHTKLQQTVDGIKAQAATICFEAKCVEINASFSAINDPDLSYDLFSADVDRTLARAYALGRTGSIVQRIAQQWRLINHNADIPVIWNVDEETIQAYLRDVFAEFETPAKNVDFTITPRSGTHSVTFTPAQNGIVLDYDRTVQQLKELLATLQTPKLTLVQINDLPTVTKVDEHRIEQGILQILSASEYQLTYEDTIWRITRSAVADGLELASENGNNIIRFNKEKFIALLQKPKDALDQQPRDAKFEIENGRVTEFQSSRQGRAVQVEESWKTANAILANATSNILDFPLQVAVVESKQSTASVNDLGITELIAVGTSNFSGSPANRRHNIKVGSDSLNGLLIAPGDEFSLVEALGEVDGTTGYKEELVIKGNETKPEYGGGLCQVGTTLFRATLDGGLPITERQNHSYRVSYYEPAGTDATIYGPHPDFRFINDTGRHVLIQTRLEGDTLVYELWGTDDGRIAETTDPVIYNITTPPPTKYVETLDLTPGQIRCTERAHNGADASFDYTVTYANGDTKEETFNSHYRAWQEVCLIGVEELTVPETDEATPTTVDNTPTDPYAENLNSLN